MQDPKDATKFCIVERYEQESSQKYHLGNPYWKVRRFCPSIAPFLVIADGFYLRDPVDIRPVRDSACIFGEDGPMLMKQPS